MHIKIARQMAIEKSGDKWQSKTLFPTSFVLCTSIVLKFRIAAYPVYNFKKNLKDIQLIFIASYRMTNEPRHVISNNVAFWHEYTQTSLCSLLLSLETPNYVRSVA